MSRLKTLAVRCAIPIASILLVSICSMLLQRAWPNCHRFFPYFPYFFTVGLVTYYESTKHRGFVLGILTAISAGLLLIPLDHHTQWEWSLSWSWLPVGLLLLVEIGLTLLFWKGGLLSAITERIEKRVDPLKSHWIDSHQTIADRKPSVFRAVYFFLFVYTIISIFSHSVTVFNAESIRSIAGQGNKQDWYYLLFAFGSVVAIHLMRIYVTLEMLEEGEYFFLGWYDNMKGVRKTFEYLIRIGIVGIVSLKLIKQFSSIHGLAIYLSILYFLLLLWDIFWWLCEKRDFRDTFFISSSLGLSANIGLCILTSSKNAEIENATKLIALVAIMTCGLCFFVIRDIVNHRVQYYKYTVEKIIQIYVSNNSDQMVTASTPPNVKESSSS